MPERSQFSNERPVRDASPPITADNSCGFVERRTVAHSRRPLAIWIWSSLLIADAVLVARRVSGEMALSLPPSLALLSMSVVALASFAAWLAFRSDSPREVISQPGGWIPLAVSLVASGLWCVTLTTQASPLAAGLLLGVTLVQCLAVLSIVGADQRLGAARLVNRESVESQRPDQSPTNPHTLGSLEPFVPADDPLDESEESVEHDESAHDEDVTQWMSRRVTDDGELVEGWLRVEFPVGQREATAHVSFCPPLSGPPAIETEDLDGGDLEIRVGTAFPFGTRLTVRRSGSTAQATSGRIGFVAVVAANQRAA
ncbi:MAG: hypothetical protein AABP62_17595 [Planctomycetota bacterium]